jgi:hypothetical protein
VSITSIFHMSCNFVRCILVKKKSTYREVVRLALFAASETYNIIILLNKKILLSLGKKY